MSETVSQSRDSGQHVVASHPDRMATMATLHGLTPPAVGTCRVLELGCAEGSNLLPMAQSLPAAQFVGIDGSPRKVAQARSIINQTGLRNVEIKSADLLASGEDLGRFDYIICHGMYSSVAADVRKRILAICAENLNPHGIAYVSFNAYPGWHLRKMVRDVLRHHTQGITDARDRVAQAKLFLNFLASAASPADGPYALTVQHEASAVDSGHDASLLAEPFDDASSAFSFLEFTSQAADAGLQFVAPARFHIAEANLGPDATRALQSFGADRLGREQYLDYFLGRSFRQTLLCHTSLGPVSAPKPDSIRSLRMVALSRPESSVVDVNSPDPLAFVTIYGDKITINHPLLKAALVALCRIWPKSATHDELAFDAFAQLGQGNIDIRTLAPMLLQAHTANLVDLVSYDPPIATAAGEYPRACAYARWQVERDDRPYGLRHRTAVLEKIDTLVLRLLDGTRDRSAILDVLAGWVADDTLQIHQDERAVQDESQIRTILAETLEPSLKRIAGEALLITE